MKTEKQTVTGPAMAPADWEVYWNQLAMGEAIRPSLIALKEQCKETEGRKLLQQHHAGAPELLWGLLDHEDAKVRKNAVLLLGMAGEDSGNGPDRLWQAYLAESTLFVRSSYLKALSELIRGRDIPETLRAALEERRTELENCAPTEEEAKHIAEELRELRSLLPQKHEKHRYREPARPVRVILTCAKEVRSLLYEQVCEIHGEETKETGLGIMTRTARLDRLAALRIYQEMLFPLNGMKVLKASELVGGILEGNLFPLLGLLHEKNGNAYAFRLSAPTEGVDARRLARQLEAHSGNRLINSVSDYEIELKLLSAQEEGFRAFLKLYTKKDERFAYRKGSIATSMNPVRAASMVALCRDYLKPGAQLLDPYCGVGTLLIERCLAVPGGSVYGVDTFKEAIDLARENTKASGLPEIYYIHRNSHDFTSEYLFDEIFTEMPRLSAEETDAEYREFLSHSYGLLREKGLILMATDRMGPVHKYLRLMSDRYKLLREIPLREKEDERICILQRI